MTAPRSRAVVLAALVVASVAICIVLLTGDRGYTIHARFLNADGLVEGGRVEVAGRKIGSIHRIDLSDDGEALVDLSISDGQLRPLHEGTRAAVRAVGQAGLANRFVELTPGPSVNPNLPNGATLPTTQTSGIINIDALLDSFGPRNRTQLQRLIANSSRIYAGSGARSFNLLLRRLAPSSRAFAGVARDVALDRRALSELVDTAATASTALAGRSDDLSAAVRNTATSFGAIAAQRRALSDLLARAPAVLGQATGALRHTRSAITALRPALRDVPPAAGPLRDLLTHTDALFAHARPTLVDLNRDLPRLTSAFSGLRPLERPLTQALRTTGTSMAALRPILEGTRYYGPDLILGVVSGLVGVVSGPYDARGHYAKLNFIQSPQTLTSGPLAEVLQQHPLLPSLLNSRTGLTRRCPGGLVPPAPDGSSPWPLGEKFCSESDDIPASVNEP